MERKYIVDLMDEIKRQLEMPVGQRDASFLSIATLALKDRLEILEEVANNLRQQTEKLQSDLYIDPLTLLYTRRGLEVHLEQLDKSLEKKYGIILADICGLKKINDTYGFDVGDYVIRMVSFGLRGRLKAEDFICRYGYSRSDEFLVVTENTQNAKEMISRIRRIKTTLFDRPFNVELYVSYGEYQPHYEGFKDAYSRVSQALNKQKRSKKSDANPA